MFVKGETNLLARPTDGGRADARCLGHRGLCLTAGRRVYWKGEEHILDTLHLGLACLALVMHIGVHEQAAQLAAAGELHAQELPFTGVWGAPLPSKH
jgi:hypothetical protein